MKKFLSLFLTFIFLGSSFACMQTRAGEVIVDEFVERTLKGNAAQYAERAPVYISPEELLSTKSKKFHEGKIINFFVAEDYYIGDKLEFAKGTPVIGRVELISKNDIMGVPADLIIGNFLIKNGNKTVKLEGSISQIGANRAVWVGPTGYVLGVITLGVGCSVWLIRGGHAKIKPGELYAVVYSK